MFKDSHLQFPLHFTFKISTLASDFIVTNSRNEEVSYVRQKLFKLKESVQVYKNQQKTEVLYNINANKWIDFNTTYTISKPNGNVIGTVARKGMRSIWKATYAILDTNKKTLFTIEEDNAWVKFWDGLVSEIPLVGMFTGYFLNPSYSVKNAQGKVYYQLKKQPSFWGRRFVLEKINEVDSSEVESLIVNGLMMMVLMEKNRG
ncbi:hypothetical protein AB4865_04500 [Capnocytophaga sp. ARDL2]|uniref:hypothetical protein n=1 Tax=Capnocytophaga sp. ARDL2 TaxID=3238809 RepID=UPI0035576FE6